MVDGDKGGLLFCVGFRQYCDNKPNTFSTRIFYCFFPKNSLKSGISEHL